MTEIMTTGWGSRRMKEIRAQRVCKCGSSNITYPDNNRFYCKCESCGALLPRRRRKINEGGKWKPLIRDVEQEESMPQTFGILLTSAFSILQRRTRIIIEDRLMDEHGIFAYLTNLGVLCARQYIWGSVVSCHKRIIYSALNINKPVIMYIANAGKFYAFQPKDLIEYGKENERGGVTFVNFNVSLGVKIYDH
jgi:hypothetical protein